MLPILFVYGFDEHPDPFARVGRILVERPLLGIAVKARRAPLRACPLPNCQGPERGRSPSNPRNRTVIRLDRALTDYDLGNKKPCQQGQFRPKRRNCHRRRENRTSFAAANDGTAISKQLPIRR